MGENKLLMYFEKKPSGWGINRWGSDFICRQEVSFAVGDSESEL